jgi:uncharacterized membrane protein YcaP (DUF421 family)
MMKARISEDEFESYLRLSGNDDISDIKLNCSHVEINGQVLSKQRKKTEKNSATTTIIGCCLYIYVVWMQF